MGEFKFKADLLKFDLSEEDSDSMGNFKDFFI